MDHGLVIGDFWSLALSPLSLVCQVYVSVWFCLSVPLSLIIPLALNMTVIQET